MRGRLRASWDPNAVDGVQRQGPGGDTGQSLRCRSHRQNKRDSSMGKRKKDRVLEARIES